MQTSTVAFARGLMVALLFITALDLTVRALEPRLSGDIANTLSFPIQVAELSASGGKRVAAIGNSLIGDGLDTEIFMANWLDANPGAGHAIKLVPDASGIWDWHCIAHYRLANASPPPDLVLIGFGWNQLSDQNRLSLTRAFNALCPVSAMRHFSALSGQVGVNGWLEMLAVKTSKLYAQRQAIRHRVLDQIIPGYRGMTRQINARAGQGDEPTPARLQRRLSYTTLEMMLDRLAEEGTEVVLVAMPVMNPYEVDPGLCDVVAGTPHRLLDLRFAVPASREFYRDNLHLNAEGARLFSETLAGKLRADVPSMSGCSG